MHRLWAVALLPAICTMTCAATLPWPFDMRVEEVTSDRASFRVTTTGATFEFLPAEGTIAFSQRIEGPRRLGSLTVGPDALRGLRILEHSDESVKLRSASGVFATVTCDSVLRLDSGPPLSIVVDGSFSPEYLRVEPYGALALDTSGGFGFYPLGTAAKQPTVAQSSGAFTIRQHLPARGTFLIGVCPPRAYNWTQHREERIVHQFPKEVTPGVSDRPLPTDEELVAWRKMGNVLVLHLEFWDGFGVRRIKPKDPTRFREVIDLAHKLGYLVLPYSSPFYYTPAYAPGGQLRADAVDLYLEEVRWLLQEYRVDGLYWDGEFPDVLKAWECIRQTRKLLGSRRLYVHCTTLPLRSVDVYCPFVDTWADYLLRGEGLRRDHVDPVYLRYVVSGYSFSNAIGELCYENCRLDRTVFDWALGANFRIPCWPGLQVHSGAKYFLLPEEAREFRAYYLPTADSIHGPRDLAPWAAEGTRQRQARGAELAARRAAREAALAGYLADRKQKAAPQVADNLAAFKGGECSDWTRRDAGPHGLGFPLAYATDQAPDTYWGADGLPQWLTVDLGRVATISRVWVLTCFEDQRHYHYRVEVSPDNSAWYQVGRKMEDSAATAAGETYRFTPRQARYVRVTILANSANDAGHIAELGVYR